ncbi:MAG: hypothetical protein EXS09_02925 [Gemmataceae bacterium]|nr:hypothetical protein [Gemmataceae bacterium]
MKAFSFSVLLAVGVAVGCEKVTTPPALPELQPVKGQILRGTQPVSGGYLTLRSDTNQDLMVTAKVGEDGTFEAFTTDTSHKDSQRAVGVPVGTYRGEYGPPSTDQSIQPIPLKAPIHIVAGPNELKIVLPKK